MVWIIALLCMGVVGVVGYYRGPICGVFSLLGLFFGILLAAPLAPLAQRLLPVLGLSHPVWQLFVPQLIAFLVILTIFKIVGHVLHQKMTLHFKYQKDERLYFSWDRLYRNLGFCVGLVNGAVYFFLLMMPVYVAGYFATEAAGENASGGVHLLAGLRAQLHETKVDRVLARYDPIPPRVYQAGDIVDLVLHNPLLESRVAHYPPLLSLTTRPEIAGLSSDAQLQQMIQTQAKVGDILAYPTIHALATNDALINEISALVGNNLSDLQDFLNTGKSPKFDSETILGVWTVDLRGTLDQAKKRNPSITPRQMAALRLSLGPLVTGLSLTATPDNQVFLKKQNPNSTQSTVVDHGNWAKSGDSYEITLPTSKPSTSEISMQAGSTLLLPRDGYVLVFNKEM